MTVFHPIRQFVNSPNGMRVDMSLSSYQRWNYRVNNRFCVWVRGSGASLAGCSLSQKDNSISNTPPHYSEQRSGTGLSNGFAQHSLWIASVLYLPKLAPNHFFLFFFHFIYFDVCFENSCNKFVLIMRVGRRIRLLKIDFIFQSTFALSKSLSYHFLAFNTFNCNSRFILFSIWISSLSSH